MAAITVQSNARAWREVSSTIFWTARSLWDTGSALYAVVQDTGATPKVRVMKADSRLTPTSFSEQDSGNNKAIANVDYPYDSFFDGQYIHVWVFTATNTITHYKFDTATDLWTTGLGTATTNASNERSIRSVYRASDTSTWVFYTDLTDDADIARARFLSGAWTVAVTHDINSTAASGLLDVGSDSNSRLWALYQSAAASNVNYIRYIGTTIDGPTVSGSISTGAETAYAAGGRFATIDPGGGTNAKVLVAYINSAGLARSSELTITSTGTASSNFANHLTVEATAANVGTRSPVSTAISSGGTRYQVWWDDANSGTIYYSVYNGTSWGSAVAFATGVTMVVEIIPVGAGIAVTYQSGSDVVIDFIVSPSGASVNDSDTISPTLSEAESIAAAIPESDTIAPTLSESESTTSSRTDTDTISPTLSEAESIAATVSDSDTISPTLSESESVAITQPIDETDTISPTLSETESTTAAVAQTDTISPTLSEVESYVASVPDTDTIAPTLSEAETITSSRTDTDTIAPTLSEAEAVAAAIPQTDTIAPALSEVETLATANPQTDTISPTLTEVESVVVSIAETDTIAPTLSESESLVQFNAISDSDTISPTLTEVESVVVTVSQADTLSVILDEVEALVAAISDTDTITPTLDELGSVGFDSFFTEYDTLDILWSEFELVEKAQVQFAVPAGRPRIAAAQRRKFTHVATKERPLASTPTKVR